ncbi:hypothetical protein B0H12DRAFT_1082597, partial [Mycena haematopus]
MPPRPSNAALDGAEAAFLTAMEDLDLVFGMPKVSSMSGFIPFKECLLSMDHHPAKEALFHLRELNNSSVRETKYRSPTAAMNEIHATLVWYERARDEARAQSLAKNKKGKKAIKSSATIEDSVSESDQSASSDDDEDRADNEVLDLNWVVRKLMALQMEVDTVKTSQSTNTESRAGSGTVPSGLHFSKGNAASSQAAPVATVSTGLKNKDDKAQAKEIRDKEVKAADAAERRAKGK